MSLREHIYENCVILEEYPKSFKLLSKPVKDGIEINVSYKGNVKKLGLITLEKTEMVRDGQAYFLNIGKGYSDDGFGFVHHEENFEFEEVFSDQIINKEKKQIKLLLVPASDFVEIGKQILIEVLDQFASDETHYNYIHKDWKK